MSPPNVNSRPFRLNSLASGASRHGAWLISAADLIKIHGAAQVGVVGRMSAAIWIESRIASPEVFPEAELLPHLICSRPMFIGGANDEADQHGSA